MAQLRLVKLDLSLADGYVISEEDEFKRELGKASLDNCIYSVINKTSADALFGNTSVNQSQYSERNLVYGFNSSELGKVEDPLDTDLWKELDLRDDPAILVFDPTKLDKTEIDYEYSLRCPGKDAVKALIQLKSLNFSDTLFD